MTAGVSPQETKPSPEEQAALKVKEAAVLATIGVRLRAKTVNVIARMCMDFLSFPLGVSHASPRSCRILLAGISLVRLRRKTQPGTRQNMNANFESGIQTSKPRNGLEV